MRCTGYSVVRGTAISSFAVEIVDVVSGDASANDGPRILVRVSGPVVDETGVGPGFSGSPIYCRDAAGTARNAGAISESIGAYGGRTVLATPIEEILANPVEAPRPRPIGARASLDRARAAARRAAHRLRAQPRPRDAADRGGREGAANGAGGARAAARPLPRRAAAARLVAERRLLLRRHRGRRGRHRRLRRRRPRVGLRPPVREQRATLAAAPGRLRLRRDLEPERRRGQRLDLQARGRRPHARHDLQRRERRRRRPLGPAARDGAGAHLHRGRGHRRALDDRRAGRRRDGRGHAHGQLGADVRGAARARPGRVGDPAQRARPAQRHCLRADRAARAKEAAAVLQPLHVGGRALGHRGGREHRRRGRARRTR